MLYWVVLVCLLGKFTAEACSGVEIVTRSQWGARNPTGSSTLSTPVNVVLIHHTAGSSCDSLSLCSSIAKSIQNEHMDTNKWSDIGYSFLIGGDGRAYEGRGWTKVGAHSPNYNRKSIGISVMGNFENDTPSSTVLQGVKKLIECGVSNGYITKSHTVHGHKDAKCTKCPGVNLYNIIKTWTSYGGKLPDYKC
ncbi:peptidoglycan-recognition protein SC2-like [Tachypleus tridentatus]|uniref:peptidoglycan-recognition protein SC2-like n=1 Tax=Tachypleus tridentatus TaxID=6853 RepID=UPI003FD40DB8